MESLVLLGDEVALLKLASLKGVLSAQGNSLSHEIACDFFCETGLASRQGNELTLTVFGQRVARLLIAKGAVGTISILPSEQSESSWLVSRSW